MGERPANARWRIEKYLADSDDFTIGCREHKKRTKVSLVAPNEDDECSSSSTTTSSRRQSDSEETLSQASNTDASSTSQPPRNLRPPWHRQDNTNYDYSLPCEFKVVGCNHEFPPENWEDWITHTRSHFVGNAPPSEAVCIFCDGPLGTFKYRQNPASNWRHRMIHIGRHHMEHARGTRPDYFVIEHLHKHDLLSTADFEHSMEYSERLVPIDCLVPYGYKTDEKKHRERRELEVKDDLEKERRQMRTDEADQAFIWFRKGRNMQAEMTIESLDKQGIDNRYLVLYSYMMERFISTLKNWAPPQYMHHVAFPSVLSEGGFVSWDDMVHSTPLMREVGNGGAEVSLSYQQSG